MPLLANDTSGAVTRKRIETYVATAEKVTVVAATDAATVQVAATLAAAQQVVYTMTPTATNGMSVEAWGGMERHGWQFKERGIASAVSKY